MKTAIAEKLLEINRQFYNNYAQSFSQTRANIQPGVQRCLSPVHAFVSMLDFGCGNGTLAKHLLESGYSGSYLGVDFSVALLDDARQRIHEAATGNYQFRQVDISALDWVNILSNENFDLIVSFAVLHHIPGSNNRVRLLGQLRPLLKPAGRLIISNWQFLNSPKLVARILPWHTVNLDETDLEENDYLLDWRAKDKPKTDGLRYVHHFSEDELFTLAKNTGFTVMDQFYSDGTTGNLALYQTWQAS